MSMKNLIKVIFGTTIFILYLWYVENKESVHFKSDSKSRANILALKKEFISKQNQSAKKSSKDRRSPSSISRKVPRKKSQGLSENKKALAKYLKIRKKRPLKLKNNMDYYEIENLAAVKKEDYKEEFGPLIQEKGGYIIFENEVGNGPFLHIVKRKDALHFGIVTGLLKVKISKDVSPEILGTKFGLSLVHYDSDINWAYFKEEDFEKLQEKLALLREGEEVERANMDIIENLKVPK